MIEVSDGIYWIKLPMYTDEAKEDHVNIYLIRGEKSYLLVDAGWNTDESLAILPSPMAKPAWVIPMVVPRKPQHRMASKDAQIIGM